MTDDPKLNDEEALAALLAFDLVHEFGLLIDRHLAHTRGAQREHPGWVWVVYLALISHTTSARATAGFMRQKWVRSALARVAKSDEAASKVLRRKGMTRDQFAWVRYRLEGNTAFWDEANKAFGEGAATVARELGICTDPTASYTNPPLTSALFGDGKTIPAISRHARDSTLIDKATGEIIRQRRADPDARNYTDGTGAVVYGHHLVAISGRSGYTNENVILGYRYVGPKNAGGEAGAAVAICQQVVGHLDARVLVYDTALHGVHLDKLFEFGVIGVAPVTAKAKATAKTERIAKETPAGFANMTTPNGKTYEVSIHAIDGQPFVSDVDNEGNTHLIELHQKKVEHRPRRKGGNTFYGQYETPAGESVRIRFDTTDEDRANGFNRAENVRPFPPGTDRYTRLYNYRPTTESINASIQRSLGEWKTAHSYGEYRVGVDMLGFALLNNAKAEYSYRRRKARAATAA